jgi:hypothetical protein
VLLLNADAFVDADSLRQSLRHMDAATDCGVLGAQAVDEAGRPQIAARVFPTPWQNFILHTGLFARFALVPTGEPRLGPGGVRVIECDWVVGCYYMVRRDLIARIGLFDPRYFLYFEEVDHCRAVKAAGWKVECLLDTRVVHQGGASAETVGTLGPDRQLPALHVESSLLYFRKHGGLTGVVAAIALPILTDAVLALKWLLKGRPMAGLAAFWRSSATLCRLAIRTRLGSRPTR